MARSSGFGSTASYYFALLRLAFASAPFLQLNLAWYNNSPVHSSIGTPSGFNALWLLVGIRFQVLFHSPPGVLFTFPSQYWFTIGHYRVFSLSEWAPILPTRFLVSRRTQDSANSTFTSIYGAFTLYGLPSQIILLVPVSYIAVLLPQPLGWFGLFPFRSPLLRESIFFLFL